MSNTATETLSVIVEREIAYPPEKIWRALTQPQLIAEWLMKNDFKPVVDHRFNLRKNPQPDVSIVVDCQVLAVEPHKTLSYTWAAYGLESVVTWTLTPDAYGDTAAHGAIGLPAGPDAGLSRRPIRLAAVLCGPGTGIGADRLMPAHNRCNIVVAASNGIGIRGIGIQ